VFQQAPERFTLTGFRQLNTNDALVTPGNAAATDGGIEKREAVCRHGVEILALPVIGWLGKNCGAFWCQTGGRLFVMVRFSLTGAKQ